MYTHTPVAEPSTFYKSFSEKKLTTYGSSRRGRIEQHRLGLLHRYKPAPGDMVEVGPGHGTLAEQAVEAGWTLHRDRSQPDPDQGAAREGPARDRVVGAAHSGARRQRRRRLRRPGARAHERHRRGPRVHGRGPARAAARRRVVRRGARLPEGAHVLLGRRLHPQLRDHRTARQAAVQRRRLRDPARRARHRHGDRRGARRAGGRRAAREHPRRGRACRATPAPSTCCSRSARTCSKP